MPFVYNMMGQLFTIHNREEVVFTAPWFNTVLNYLGTTPVLDSAMCAFMLQLVGKAKQDAVDVTRSRDIYGQALGALQKALNHPVAWKSTETLAATILCSIFEVSQGFIYRILLVFPTTGLLFFPDLDAEAVIEDTADLPLSDLGHAFSFCPKSVADTDLVMDKRCLLEPKTR